MIDGPDPIERPDEAALEELRRAFEEPGEQFGAEVDEGVLDPSVGWSDTAALGASQTRTKGGRTKRDRTGRDRTGRDRTGRRWPFGRRRSSSDADGLADVDASALAARQPGWPVGLGSEPSMVRVLEPDEQLNPASEPILGGPGADTGSQAPQSDTAEAATDASVVPGMVDRHVDAPATGEPIRIEDEDLPDLVYLEGRLEPTGGSGGDSTGISGWAEADSPGGQRLVIDDDLGPDPVDTITESRSSVTMEPRIRDRRVEVRRAIGRKRLRMLIAGAAVMLVGVAVLAIVGSSLFGVRADQVEVIGAVYTDREALGEIIDDVVGRPTLTLDTERIEQQLRTIAWVEQARVRASFPHRLTIDIRERVPLATFSGSDGLFRVIDRHGRVLDVIRGEPVAYLLLEIPEVDNLAQGQFTTRGPAAAAELVQALTPGIRQRVQAMEVAQDGSELVVVMAPWEGSADTAAVRVHFGSTSDLLVKLVRLEAVLETAAQRNATEIDVSTVEVSIR